MNQELRDAELRYQNSKELAERAQRIADKDLTAWLWALDRAKTQADTAAEPKPKLHEMENGPLPSFDEDLS